MKFVALVSLVVFGTSAFAHVASGKRESRLLERGKSLLYTYAEINASDVINFPRYTFESGRQLSICGMQRRSGQNSD